MFLTSYPDISCPTSDEAFIHTLSVVRRMHTCKGSAQGTVGHYFLILRRLRPRVWQRNGRHKWGITPTKPVADSVTCARLYFATVKSQNNPVHNIHISNLVKNCGHRIIPTRAIHRAQRRASSYFQWRSGAIMCIQSSCDRRWTFLGMMLDISRTLSESKEVAICQQPRNNPQLRTWHPYMFRRAAIKGLEVLIFREMQWSCYYLLCPFHGPVSRASSEQWC